MRRIPRIFILILLPSFSIAQSLNGSWKGNTERSFWILNSTEIVLEIEVTNDSIISGVIHNYYTKARFEHIKISGVFDWKDSTATLVEEEEISTNINSVFFDLCLGKMELTLSKQANKYTLKGTWKDKDKGLFHCPTLQTTFTKEFTDTLHITQTNVLSSRQTDIQKVIELTIAETDSIKCALYDNGEIDNDTVSLYYNDKLILRSQRLSGSAIEFYVSFDKTKLTQKIKLVAENLGSIPPNTALLIITTRSNRYTLTLSSTYSKNGTVEFFLKE